MLELAGRMRLEQATRHVGHEELVLVQHRGRGVSAGLFDVLVDETLPLDELVRVTPTAVLDDGTLDARTSTIIKDDATPQDTGGS
jgi:threonylcarbamoyladenosine tRNA methylthiotransferase MtaB